MGNSNIESVLEDLREGKFVLLKDDESRENEGDLVMAAEHVTPEDINFMAKHARGLICAPLTKDRADELELERMSTKNTAPLATAFTVSIDARDGVSTGISAKDRAQTFQRLVDDSAESSDFARPGHLFPLIARDKGVLIRQGQTEGSVDLLKLAGLKPVAAICEVMNPDGTMAREEDLNEFCDEHDIKMCSVEDVRQYRLRNETHVEKEVEIDFPTEFGDFDLHLFQSEVDDNNHLALVTGPEGSETRNGNPPLVRVHSQCLTGEVFGSQRCDCQTQLLYSLEKIQEYGHGAVIYSLQEGRGIGLANKLKAYKLQNEGKDTVEANKELGFDEDLRSYWCAGQILQKLGLDRIRLLTNNPDKVDDITEIGVTVSERIPLEVQPDQFSRDYLQTKRDKLGHMLNHL